MNLVVMLMNVDRLEWMLTKCVQAAISKYASKIFKNGNKLEKKR